MEELNFVVVVVVVVFVVFLEGKVQELTDAVRQMQEHQSILWEENTKLKEHLYSTYESHSRVAGHVLHLQSVNEEYKAMLGDTQSQVCCCCCCCCCCFIYCFKVTRAEI